MCDPYVTYMLKEKRPKVKMVSTLLCDYHVMRELYVEDVESIHTDSHYSFVFCASSKHDKKAADFIKN